jgi:hypothetical protein
LLLYSEDGYTYFVNKRKTILYGEHLISNTQQKKLCNKIY